MIKNKPAGHEEKDYGMKKGRKKRMTLYIVLAVLPAIFVYMAVQGVRCSKAKGRQGTACGIRCGNGSSKLWEYDLCR